MRCGAPPPSAAPAAACDVVDPTKVYRLVCAKGCRFGGNQVPPQEFDGAARTNKSVSGAGAILYEDSSGQQVAVLRQKLGKANNNQAEAAALLLGMEVCWYEEACTRIDIVLQAAKALGVRRIKVQGDSDVVVRQADGKCRIKEPTQRMLLERVSKAKYSFEVGLLGSIGSDAPRVLNRLSGV